MSKSASSYKKMVILSAFLAPLFGGAIIYYSLKKSHEGPAKLGNNMSFLAVAIWIAAYLGLGKAGIALPVSILGLAGGAGIILAIITVMNIKNTDSEETVTS
jgi:hypothetical protein